MEKYRPIIGDTKCRSNSNSNAQVSPGLENFTYYSNQFGRTEWNAYPVQRLSLQQMPGISSYNYNTKSQRDIETYQKECRENGDRSYIDYPDRQPSEDECDEPEEEQDAYSDGRRSTCSLSDETSSLSEEEFLQVPNKGEESKSDKDADDTLLNSPSQNSILDDNDTTISPENEAQNASFVTTTCFPPNENVTVNHTVESEQCDMPEISKLTINQDKCPDNEPGIKTEDGDEGNKTEQCKQVSAGIEGESQNVEYQQQHTYPAQNFQPNAVYANAMFPPGGCAVVPGYSQLNYYQQGGQAVCCAWPSIDPNITVSPPYDPTWQYDPCHQAQTQQPGFIQPNMTMPCCSGYSYPSTYVNESFPNHGEAHFDKTDQATHQVPSYNTKGLFTAEQYYAGQQTPFDQTEQSNIQMEDHGSNYLQPIPQGESNVAEHCFQYPSVYVSEAGLITVLLKYDVSVEITVDKTIRVVSHPQRLVIASNSRGSSNCLYHPHAKVCHDGTLTEVELSALRKVKMTTENILMAKGDKCYKFNYTDLQESQADFRDISKDNSVTLLFGSSDYGPSYMERCHEIAQRAQSTFREDGSFRVRINDISISQSSKGEVTVLSGPRFFKMAPLSCYVRLQTHFIDMAAYKNAKVFVRRGTHSLDCNPTNLRVDNGNLEAEFEEGEDITVVRLPSRLPLNALSRRQKQRGNDSKPRHSNETHRNRH